MENTINFESDVLMWTYCFGCSPKWSRRTYHDLVWIVRDRIQERVLEKENGDNSNWSIHAKWSESRQLGCGSNTKCDEVRYWSDRDCHSCMFHCPSKPFNNSLSKLNYLRIWIRQEALINTTVPLQFTFKTIKLKSPQNSFLGKSWIKAFQ